MAGEPCRGKPQTGLHDDFSSGCTRVMPGFFETLGDRIVMGRPITDTGNVDARPVAMVNEAFARKYFGKENPIGQHFGPASQKEAGIYEIVGIASDMRYFLDVASPVAAIGAGHLIASQLFDVRPWDPLMLLAAALPLGLAALIAGMIPARRATKVDPMVALRHE